MSDTKTQDTDTIDAGAGVGHGTHPIAVPVDGQGDAIMGGGSGSGGETGKNEEREKALDKKLKELKGEMTAQQARVDAKEEKFEEAKKEWKKLNDAKKAEPVTPTEIDVVETYNRTKEDFYAARDAARDIQTQIHTATEQLKNLQASTSRLPTSFTATVLLPGGSGEFTVHFDPFPSYGVFVHEIVGDRDDVDVFGRPKNGSSWLRFDHPDTFEDKFMMLARPYVFTVDAKINGSPTSTPERGTGNGDGRVGMDGLAGAVQRLSFGDPIEDALNLFDELIAEKEFHFDEEHDSCNLRELGLHFPLVHRDEDLGRFEKVLSTQFATWKDRNHGSSDVIKIAKTLTYCGASGMGKSRMAKSLLESLQERDCGDLKDVLSRSVSLVVDCTVSLLEWEWEEKSVPRSVAARLLFFFGMKYGGFKSQYPKYADFAAEDKHQHLEPHDVVAALVKFLPDVDDQHPAMLLLLFDEVNHVSNEWVKAAMASVAALWRTTITSLMVVPCLFGTNPISVYKTSSPGDHNIKPSLLEADDHARILRKLMMLEDDWEPSPMLRVLLQDIAYNPRLLQLSLFNMSQAGRLSRLAQDAGRPSTPESNSTPAGSNGTTKGPFESSVSFKYIKHWLECTAAAEHDHDPAILCRSLFMQVIDGIDKSNFMTTVEIENADCQNFELFSTILGYAVFGSKVKLGTNLGAAVIGTEMKQTFTVGDAVEHGWVFFHGESIVLPYAYLYKIFRSQVFEVGGGAYMLPAMRSPGMELSPENNEKQDLAATCYRLLLAKLVKKGGSEPETLKLSLREWLCSESIADVDVIPMKLKITTLRSQCKVGNLDSISYEGVGAYVNAKSAPSWDSAVIVELAIGATMPDAFCTGVAVDETVSDQLKSQTTWKNHDFDSPIACGVPNALHLMVCIQSKRKASGGSLTPKDIWEEYAKVRVFAEKIPFVFLIISDGKKPDVPVELKQQVAVVTDEDMEAFFGPVVGQRRKESK